MHTRKWDPEILFPNGMGWRELLIVGVKCKKWEPGIVFSTIDFKLFGKQAVRSASPSAYMLQVTNKICSNDIGEDPMSYNASPKGCDMHQNIQPCILSSKK